MAPGDPTWGSSKAKVVLADGIKSGQVKDHWQVKELLEWNREMFEPFARNKRLASNLRANWLRLKKGMEKQIAVADKDKERLVRFDERVGKATHDHKGNKLWSKEARAQMKVDMMSPLKRNWTCDKLKDSNWVYQDYSRVLIRRKMEQEKFQAKSTAYWNAKKEKKLNKLKVYK